MALSENLRLVCLTSGHSSGSTMGEIVKATRDGRLERIEVVGMIAGKANSPSLERARGLNIPYTSYADRGSYDHPERFSEVMTAILKILKPDIIGQYGWDHQTPESTLRSLDRVSWINQHPGPVGPSEYDFGGRYMSCAPRVHAARLMFVRHTNRNFWTEVVSQRVASKLDGGAVIKSSRVQIDPTDTVATLQQKALPVEWRVQVATLVDFERQECLDVLPPNEDLVLPSERGALRLVKQLSRKLYSQYGEQYENPDLEAVLRELEADQVTMDEIVQMHSYLKPQPNLVTV